MGLPIMISVLILITSIVFSFGTIHALPVDRYWSVLEPQKQSTNANGFIGLKFREDFKQLVFNVNVNNIDNITGIYLYNRGDNTQNKNASMILDLLEESKEVKVKDKFKHDILVFKRYSFLPNMETCLNMNKELV